MAFPRASPHARAGTQARGCAYLLADVIFSMCSLNPGTQRSCAWNSLTTLVHG